MVLSYLQHLRRRNLKHSIILSHISALSSCTNKVNGVLVGRHCLVARWVLGDGAQKSTSKIPGSQVECVGGSGGTH